MAKRLDVVGFGEVLWDIFDDPKSRKEGEAIGDVLHRELGGAPANFAVVAARMGLRASVVGGVGKDVLGDALVGLLEREGVSTAGLLRYDVRTGITFVTRDGEGEPRFLFYRDGTADMALTARQITLDMADASWVLFGSSTLMTDSLARATYRMVSHAKKSGASIIVDLNVRANLWRSASVMRSAIAELVSHAHVVKASRADLAAVGGLRWLCDHAPSATLILTNGAGAARAVGPHGDVEARAKRGPCVDATGAGDAFLAGVVATLVAHRARPGRPVWKSPHLFVHALEVGHVLGKKAISRVGAVNGVAHLEQARRLATR